MGSASGRIECIYRQIESGKARCHMPDGVMQKHACPSCIKLPLVEALFSNPKMKDKQAAHLDKIHEALRQDRATLVLGAGISKPMGMPGWLGLISQMAGHARQYSHYTVSGSAADTLSMLKLENELVSGGLQIFKGVNVLESAQYIEETLRQAAGGKTVQNLIKEPLSSIIENSMTLDIWTKERWNVDYPTVSLTPLAAAQRYSLCAVAHLLSAKNGFRRALTYNFDTLLQEYLVDLFHVNPDQIFTHPGEWNTYPGQDSKDSIQIFHVHGCIPRKNKLISPSSAFPKESDQVILTENSYYDTERFGIYNWQNSIQSYYLNRDSCVFIGFSADDYNFRRILKHTGMNRRSDGFPHYLLLTVDDTARETWATVCRRSLFSDASEDQVREQTLQLLQMQLDMKTLYWEQHGFYPIWVTVDDIPNYLLSLL